MTVCLSPQQTSSVGTYAACRCATSDERTKSRYALSAFAVYIFPVADAPWPSLSLRGTKPWRTNSPSGPETRDPGPESMNRQSERGFTPGPCCGSFRPPSDNAQIGTQRGSSKRDHASYAHAEPHDGHAKALTPTYEYECTHKSENLMSASHYLSGNGDGSLAKRLRVTAAAPLPPPSGLLARVSAFLPQIANANARLAEQPPAQSAVELVDRLQPSSSSHSSDDEEEDDASAGEVEMTLALVEADSSDDDVVAAAPTAHIARNTRNRVEEV